MKLIKWLFPHGLGTRAVLAFVIIGMGMWVLRTDATAVKELVVITAGWYFLDRGRNGATANGDNGVTNATN